MTQSEKLCPYKKLAQKKSIETGQNIDLDDGWFLFLPSNLKQELGELPNNVYYSNATNQALFCPSIEDYCLSTLSSMSSN